MCYKDVPPSRNNLRRRRILYWTSKSSGFKHDLGKEVTERYKKEGTDPHLFEILRDRQEAPGKERVLCGNPTNL